MVCSVTAQVSCTLFKHSRLEWMSDTKRMANHNDYRAVTARDLLLHNVTGGVEEAQCACTRNGLFTSFQYTNMLSGAQRRRYMNIAELIGNVNHFLLFRNGA